MTILLLVSLGMSYSCVALIAYTIGKDKMRDAIDKVIDDTLDNTDMKDEKAFGRLSAISEISGRLGFNKER